jgi:hypothetical protein
VPGALSVRAGIETGPAVIGSLGAGYGAVGEVVGAAAALQSAAKACSVLVGPVTRAATEGTFEWSQTEEVVLRPGTKPLVASYLERPFGYRGRGRRAGAAALVGRDRELAVLDEVMRATTSGAGSVLFIVGEPGLGKTRLVQESRKRFMAWVGAGTGRLPLWLEGRCASYASSTPYGLYQQLLSAWVGAAPEEDEEAVRSALERAMKAIFGGHLDHAGLLAHMMGLRPGREEDYLARLSPEGLQRATFAAIRAFVAQLVGRGPTVLVLEDLHWADPTSLRLTEELAKVASEGPLFLLATRRPEPDAGVPALESALEADTNCLLRRLELSPLPSGPWPGLSWGLEQAKRSSKPCAQASRAIRCSWRNGSPRWSRPVPWSGTRPSGTSATAPSRRSLRCWNASSGPEWTGSDLDLEKSSLLPRSSGQSLA